MLVCLSCLREENIAKRKYEEILINKIEKSTPINYEEIYSKNQSIKRKRYRRDKIRKGTVEYCLYSIFSNVISRSKLTGIPTDIDHEYLKELLRVQNNKCAITGLDLEFESGSIKNKNKRKISLDRIDSSKFYLKDNVWFVCWFVNQLKNNLSIDDLIFFARCVVRKFGENNGDQSYVP